MKPSDSRACVRCSGTIVRPPRHPGPLPRVCGTCRAADALLLGVPVSTESPAREARLAEAQRRAEAEAPGPVLAHLDELLRDVERRAARLDELTRPLRPGARLASLGRRQRFQTRSSRGPVKTVRWGERELSYGRWVCEPDVAPLGLTAQALYERIKGGWAVEEALTTPKGAKRARSENAA